MPGRKGAQHGQAARQRLHQTCVGIIVGYRVTPPSTWIICPVM
jgi:hypothetical protein